MRRTVINILIIISLIAMIGVSIYFEINGEKFYSIEINKTLRLIGVITNIIIFGIYNIKNLKDKTKNILIILFFIVLLIVPVYKTGKLYAPTGPNSIFEGVAIEIKYLNVYGIKIYDNK